MLNDTQLQFLMACVRDIIDFPRPGIIYKDISTLLNNRDAFQLINRHLVARYQQRHIDYVVGIESRGFIFGAVLAHLLNVGFVPLRKKGKLPSKVISREYALEYGVDSIEMHVDAFRDIKNAKTILVDDILATGGTALAAIELVEAGGGRCLEACFVGALPTLGGKEKLKNKTPIYALLNL